MQRLSQYPWHINDIRAEQVFGKKNKKLELYSPGLFVTDVEINEKSFSTVVVTVP